jgi:hypothetical protein
MVTVKTNAIAEGAHRPIWLPKREEQAALKYYRRPALL